MDQYELYHYGVVGMKWGVRRAQYKLASNAKLKDKALKYDKKSAQMTKKSEKIHAKQDIERSNRKAISAAKQVKKSTILEKKALSTNSDMKRAVLERRAEKLKYKAAKNRLASNRISKTTGYGNKAMKYSIKSDKAAKKAAKARMHIANNSAYVAKMNRRISSLSQDELRGAYSFVNELIKD